MAGVAAAVLMTGCGDADDGKSAGSASPSPTVVVASSDVPTVEPSPEFPATPEGDIDRAAAEKGWVVDALYDGSASAFVADMCASLPESGLEISSRPQWLAEGGHLKGDGKAVLELGIPKLCPKWTATLRQAVSGKYDRWFSSGTFVVSSKPVVGEDGEPEQTIPPGTYRAKGEMENCYWERTSESGEIIDNNFATSARSITVTIRSSDGQFTSRECGVWKPVK